MLEITASGKILVEKHISQCNYDVTEMLLTSSTYTGGIYITGGVFYILYIQSCLSTTRPVITLIGCNAVGRASRFFGRQGFFFFFFFFKSCISFLTANCFIFYVLCHDALLPLCLLYIYSYLFYCFMSENSSLELMFMFIQPTLSFLYALLVSRVGKYD